MFKIFERFIEIYLSPYAETLSSFILAYVKSDNSIYVLLRLKENCKKPLDNKDFADIVLMDLSKVFDYIPPDLLVSKFHAYNLSKYAQSFVYSFFW